METVHNTYHHKTVTFLSKGLAEEKRKMAVLMRMGGTRPEADRRQPVIVCAEIG